MNDKKTLTLEAGKFYVSKNGTRSKCLAPSQCDGDFIMQVVKGGGLFKVSSCGYCFWADWTAGHNATALSIVAEWVEPKRIKGWINVYHEDAAGDFQAGYIFAKREMADKQVNACKRIACIEIDALEGQGLEGGK